VHVALVCSGDNAFTESLVSNCTDGYAERSSEGLFLRVVLLSFIPGSLFFSLLVYESLKCCPYQRKNFQVYIAFYF